MPDGVSRGLKIMVCGMPNVGKSSLLNALRRVGCHKGKAVSEAPMPGHTRSVGNLVKIAEPSKLSGGMPVYIFDTPGIMPFYLGRGDDAAARAFNIALTAGLKDSLFDSFDLTAYLLHLLLIRYSTPPHTLAEIFSILSLPTSLDLIPIALDPTRPLPTEEFLELIARRIGALMMGGIPDLEAAAQWLLKCFRDGRFGQWTLDDAGQYKELQQTLQPQLQSVEEPIQACSDTESSDTGLESYVTSTVSDWLSSGGHRPQSRTAIKMAERRKGKAVQRANSLSNLQKRRSKR